MANETVTYDLATILSEMRGDIKQLLINQSELKGVVNENNSRLEGKIETNNSRLEGKIETNNSRLEGKIETIGGKIETLETDVKEIKEDLKNLRKSQAQQFWGLAIALLGVLGTAILRVFPFNPTP